MTPQPMLKGGQVVYVDPVSDLSDFGVPVSSPGGQMIAGPRAALLNPRPPASTALVIPYPPQNINTDPPPGIPVIQTMPNGRLAVLPLAYFGYPGDDAGSINAAFLQAGHQIFPANVQTGAVGGAVDLLPMAYNVQSTVLQPISLVCRGGGQATVINYSGTGDCWRWYDPIGPSGGHGSVNGFGAYHTIAGGIYDMHFDGTNAGAGSRAIHLGDQNYGKMRGVSFDNWANDPTTIALYFQNVNFWCEKGDYQAEFRNCSNAVVHDVLVGQGEDSYEFNKFDWNANVLFPGQNYVTFQNGAYLSVGELWARGNMINGNTGSGQGIGIQLNGSDSSSSIISHISNSHIEWHVETDSGGTISPVTIQFQGSPNTMKDNHGGLYFQGTWVASNAIAANFAKFGGPILGDATLQGLNTAPDGWP